MHMNVDYQADLEQRRNQVTQTIHPSEYKMCGGGGGMC